MFGSKKPAAPDPRWIEAVETATAARWPLYRIHRIGENYKTSVLEVRTLDGELVGVARRQRWGSSPWMFSAIGLGIARPDGTVVAWAGGLRGASSPCPVVRFAPQGPSYTFSEHLSKHDSTLAGTLDDGALWSVEVTDALMLTDKFRILTAYTRNSGVTIRRAGTLVGALECPPDPKTHAKVPPVLAVAHDTDPLRVFAIWQAALQYFNLRTPSVGV